MSGWLTNNIGWKLLSIAGAVVLWISVASEPERRENTGGAFTIMVATPQSTNSQTFSDAVHAVTSAITPKMAHRKQSLRRVDFTSLTALRRMMAITAAPIP